MGFARQYLAGLGLVTAERSPRGFAGRGRGLMRSVPMLPRWRGSSVQLCGLWPFAAGSPVPIVGVPMGRHIGRSSLGQAVCFDPISWFERAGIISTPSMFMFAEPGLGKSTFMRHMIMGLAGYGVTPMVLGDMKPDYVDLVRALGGQVIRLAPGAQGLNILDTGFMGEAVKRLEAEGLADDARELKAKEQLQRKRMLELLVKTSRGTQALPSHEQNLIRDLLVIADEQLDRQPLIADMLAILRAGDDQRLHNCALSRGDMARYKDRTEELEAALMTIEDYTVFSQPTSEPMRLDRPVVFDISGLPEGSSERAISLLACWTYGFGNIDAHHRLADAGLIERGRFFTVMDELWEPLRLGHGVVDYIDSLSRLDRQWGVGNAMITHTPHDFESIVDKADRVKAMGLVDRASATVLGGLSERDIDRLNETKVQLSGVEAELIASWNDQPVTDSAGNKGVPLGRGKFLIKTGKNPGIPVKVMLTEAEVVLNDTNKRWANSTSMAGAA